MDWTSLFGKTFVFEAIHPIVERTIFWKQNEKSRNNFLNNSCKLKANSKNKHRQSKTLEQCLKMFRNRKKNQEKQILEQFMNTKGKQKDQTTPNQHSWKMLEQLLNNIFGNSTKNQEQLKIYKKSQTNIQKCYWKQHEKSRKH